MTALVSLSRPQPAEPNSQQNRRCQDPNLQNKSETTSTNSQPRSVLCLKIDRELAGSSVPLALLRECSFKERTSDTFLKDAERLTEVCINDSSLTHGRDLPESDFHEQPIRRPTARGL
jgi:hypothetical protein